MSAPTTGLESLLDQPSLLLKRLVLLGGGMYFAFVAVTNAINFIASVGGLHWTFLNSGNVAYIASVTKVDSFPVWANDTVVLLAVWHALCWNVVVWLGFIAGTEFFTAYTSEGPFRELLIIALAMAVVIAVVPDRIPPERA